MTFGPQDFIALAIVSAAVVYLAVCGRRVWRKKSASRCGSGCGSCPASDGFKPLVTLEGLEPVRKR